MANSDHNLNNIELLKKDALFKATLESTGDGILIVDNHGKVTHYNEQFIKIWGLPKELIDSKDDEKLLDFVLEQLEEPMKFLSKVHQLYTSFDNDYDILKFKDNRIIERFSRPLIIEKEIAGRVWNFKDITKQIQVEENLTKSEEKYRFLYENTPVMLHSIDSEGKLISVSNLWLEVLGYERKEVIGRKSTEFLTESSREYANEFVLPEFYKKGFCKNVPYQYIKKDGKVIDVLLSATSEKDKDGKVTRSLAVLTDITERKRTEESLKKSEESYAGLFNSVTDAIYIQDKDGVFIDVNDGALKMYGYTREELVGKNPGHVSAPGKNDMEEVSKLLKKVMTTGKPERFEFWGRRKNGEIFPKDIISSKGKYFGENVIISAARDITEQKKATEKMRLNERRLRQIIDLDPNFIFAKDIEGRFILVNKAVADAYGTTVKELIGKKDADFSKSEEEVKNFREKDLEVINSGKPTFIPEEKITDATGRVRYLQTIKIPFTFSGTKVPAVLGVSGDITGRKQAEEKLINSEKLLSSFFNSPGVARGIVEIVNNDVLFISVNEAAKDYHGFTNKEMENKYSHDLKYSEELRDLWIKNYKESHKKGIPLRFEYFSKNFEKWFSALVCFIGMGQNKNPRYIYMLSDITERRKSEQENILLAQTLKSVKDAISITDMDDTIIFVNDAFLTTYGFTQKELEGKKISEVRSVEISSELSDKIFTETMKGGWHGELINRRKDGSMFPIELWTSIVKDSNGKNIATVGVARDITERKSAIEALKHSEEKYRSLVDNINIGVFRTTPEGLIMQTNPAFLKIFEYESLEDILKTNVSELYKNKGDRELFLMEIQKDGHLHNKEIRMKKKDGSLIWISLTGTASFDNQNKLVWIDGVIDDITDLKKANEELIKAKEKAEESERIKSNFLSNMSHELRTPMVGILGYSEFLRETKDEDIRLMADTINKSGTRLLETLNLILDLSRIEHEMIELIYENIDIIKIAREVMNLFKVPAEKKNLKFELITATKEFNAYLDERILHQIFNNLINNAIKYTNSGSVTVEISSNKISGEEAAVIKVIDTGIGIPDDKQQIIFEEFRQASEGHNRSFEGTGLGLTITKSFIEAMKGEIKLESKPGIGSVFTVTLPIKVGVPEEIKDKKTDSKITQKEFRTDGNYEVLCVDDDETNNALVNFILKKFCKIDFAINDKIATELARKKKYDIILMDINLGYGKSGLDVVKLIRKIPGYEKTPIVALTAFAMKGDKEEFLTLGCDYYLSKPYSGKELKNIVAKAMEGAINN